MRFICIALVAACAGTKPTVPPPVTPIALAPCKVANVERDARCGTYEVFEDRAHRSGRKIALKVVVVPATSPAPAKDAVMWLHGGPGAPATQTAAAAGPGGFLEGIGRDRDLVFVDQRGTGDSNPLACDLADDPADLAAYFGELFPLAKVRACRAKVAAVADPRLYTTPIAVDDFDEVRAALGYDQVDLVAASYGTIAALVYLRQHAEHVRSAFLLGVANTNVRQPLLFPRAAQHAMDLLLEDCAADAACHQAFPDLAAELHEVLARFDRGPITANLVDPKTHQAAPVAITRANFVERIRLMLYTTTFGAFVPLVIHQAHAGDFVPFESLSIAYNPGSLLARGLYLSVTCSEGAAFIAPGDIPRASANSFLGEERVRAHVAACAEWPRGNVGDSFIAPVKSSVPVLMFSGALDGSTPPWLGAEALRYLPNGRQLQARYYGHQLDSPCVWGVLAEFIAKGSAKDLDTRCVSEIRRPPFALALPPQLSLSS
jgi:pimeloyl-ACP methyl ester carboxylesterase